MTSRSNGVVAGATAAVVVALCASASGARAPAGALVQLAGRGGCLRVSRPAFERCTRAVGIGPGSVAVSADGRNLYVTGQTALSAFARRPDGALRQLSGRSGCIAYHVLHDEPRANARCARAKFLWPTSMALSPDGRNVYVTSWSFDRRVDDHSELAVFARDRTTGALRQLSCLGPSTRGGCAAARALYGPKSVVVSPDGRNVYVASVGGLTVFARDARSGALRQLAGSAGCVLASQRTAVCSHRGALHDFSPALVAVSPDGRNVYAVTSRSGSEALVVFRRNRTSGALTQASCVADPAINGTGCRAAPGFVGPWGCYSLALGPDSRSLYVGTCGDLIVLSTTAAGRLKQTGCIDAIGPRGHPCEGDTGDWPATGIAVSPDGRNLYFAYTDGRRPEPGGIAVFARAANGSLIRLRGAAGCLTWDGSAGVCTKGRGLDNPAALALSPDGRNLYSSGFSGTLCTCWNGVVAEFRRTP